MSGEIPMSGKASQEHVGEITICVVNLFVPIDYCISNGTVVLSRA